MCRRQYANDACNRGTAGRRVIQPYRLAASPFSSRIVRFDESATAPNNLESKTSAKLVRELSGCIAINMIL